ncbi:AbrB family transcriptional regulator [Mycolicibacterium sp. 120270]|uniref:AbrB family transcriptional regulator n=1 Tax=Mycolicibacterium sp. 120270 TaxID=3090600 RepID=UPI00299D8979|nr:AbrB family transcriptional regulator [Mycolicibacterium sp. 120270]MDX1886329.1 AbrB family transcriptional regulator [Mycolicibacterium sp. 120270]
MKTERLRRAAKWVLLVAVTVAVTVPLTILGVPSAALFAALVVGIALALPSLAPCSVPRSAGIAAQGVLGVYIGTMVHRDAVSALGPDWPIVVTVAVATLALSILAGALLGLHRDVSPLTGSLALVAGGASGLVAIARELGGDDRVVAVVQYLRVGLVTASMPVVVTLIYHADRTHHASASATQSGSAPWYSSIALMAVLVVAGAACGRLLRLPGAGLLGPLALTVALQLTGLSFGLSVPNVLVQIGYMVIGWQAGVVFTRDALRAVGRMLPAAIALIVLLGVVTAGFGVLLADIAGKTPLEGYLATSPGGVYAVLAIAAETGSGVTFIIAAQVFRVLLMLFTAPLLARTVIRLTDRHARRQSRAITAASREPVRAAD